jgi:hypothetical protein
MLPAKFLAAQLDTLPINLDAARCCPPHSPHQRIWPTGGNHDPLMAIYRRYEIPDQSLDI